MNNTKKCIIIIFISLVGCGDDKESNVSQCGQSILEAVEDKEGLLIATIFGPGIFSLEYGLIIPCNFEESKLSIPITGADAQEIVFSGTLEVKENDKYWDETDYSSYPHHGIVLSKVSFSNAPLTLPNGLFIAVDEYFEADTVGYGYRAEISGFRINQDLIPGVAGFCKFRTAAEAKKMAYLEGFKLTTFGALPPGFLTELCIFLIVSHNINFCLAPYDDLIRADGG